MSGAAVVLGWNPGSMTGAEYCWGGIPAGVHAVLAVGANGQGWRVVQYDRLHSSGPGSAIWGSLGYVGKPGWAFKGPKHVIIMHAIYLNIYMRVDRRYNLIS